MQVLLVEDDENLGAAMRFHLEKEGYKVDLCHNGEEALHLALQQAHELMILDRMLPGLDGLSILSKVRSAGLGTPVLMVTALDGVGERVAGLDNGADDYLVKPFAVEEFLARVRSLSRRCGGWENSSSLELKDLSLDPARHLLQSGARSISLSKREAQLMEVLLRNPGSVIPRAILFAKVWGADAPVEEGNLDNYIHFLRKRLKSVGSKLQIKTVRSVGYSLQTKESSGA